MNFVTVQDNVREKYIIDLFGLTNAIGADRHPNGSHDAETHFCNGIQHWELKTTSKNSVSTARDFGMRHIQRYRSRYWLVSEFRNLSSGPEFLNHYFVPTRLLDIHWLTPKSCCFDEKQRLLDQVCPLVDPSIVRKIRAIFERGMTENDPNIPMSLIRRIGIQICGNHQDALQELVEKYPLEHQSMKNDSCSEFFCFD